MSNGSEGARGLYDLGRSLKSPPKDTNVSGGSRFATGKPGGFWFAPLLGLRLVAPIWEGGAEKYAPMDWHEGQDYSQLLDCAFRHILQVLAYGVRSRDADSGELHLAHAAWNILALLTFMEEGRDEELDDIEKWRGVTAAQKREMEGPQAPEDRSGVAFDVSAYPGSGVEL